MIGEDESDNRLMQRTAEGDPAAFDLIVQRHQHRLQRYASRMLGGDQARAAEVAVGALLRLWESRSVYQPCGKLGAWLLKTAHRLCVNLLSQTRPLSLLDAGAPEAPASGPQSRLEHATLAQAVRDAVMDLPEAHRSVLILSVYEEMSYDDIAEALDISPGTVASRKNHAIAMLRRRLAAWETR